ncbi:MAG: 4a-hydroxytetrahydrobiopterin dehydratase [Caldilineales bacterium]|nr:4a-hydroxytetrahydrobiopterin dehydratase [Caldilineales bacterium]
MSTPLADMTIQPYGPEKRPLTREEMDELLPQVPQWTIVESADVPWLERRFRFPNFVRALTFTNAVGALAEAINHHPAILTEWGAVTVRWWTHAVKGIHLNDFIAAAKTDRLFAEQFEKSRS